MPLIGTAGHVDHGKSTLIQQITGRNPDRWAEERQRGLTIDLGFAWAVLPGGSEVSFVDVPGHERFLKNMLAGIEAIDAVLFVVAADEGWMPQSEEHLAILDLLEIERGAVAVTKSDAVEPDLTDLAAAEVSEKLVGTTLEGVQVLPVSGTTGQGVPELLEVLEGQLGEARDIGRPRLWVDRSFPVAGAGTVVTGTLLDGSLAIDDVVTVLPEGRTARIRGIQTHERSVEQVGPGRRVALNLGGVDHHDISRGDHVGSPDDWLLSDRLVASIHPARYMAEIEPRGAFQIHLGTAAVPASLTGIEDDRAVLQLQSPLPLAVGDRYILRETGARLVAGGGRVLDPDPGSTRQALRLAANVDPGRAPAEIAMRLIDIRGMDTTARLRAHSGGGVPPGGMSAAGRTLSNKRVGDVTLAASKLVDEEHRTHPLRNGLALATLAERLNVPPEIAEEIVDSSKDLIRVGPDVARPGHEAELTEAQSASWEKAHDALARGLDVPSESELGLESDVVGLKLRTGELVRIDESLVYLSEQIDEIETVIRNLDQEFTVADFRDAAGLSRKYAVPILEWADRKGLTVRRGDVRRLR